MIPKNNTFNNTGFYNDDKYNSMIIKTMSNIPKNYYAQLPLQLNPFASLFQHCKELCSIFY